MTRVVLDTNVFISGYGFGGRPRLIVDAAVERRFVLVTSSELLAELARVLVDRLRWPQRRAREYVMQIIAAGEHVRPRARLAVCRDEADNRVLECAAEGRADLVVTGDRELLALGAFRGIRIVSVADACGELGL